VRQATLLAGSRLDDWLDEADPEEQRDALALQAIMARRRSIRRLQPGPFSPAMAERLRAAVAMTPAAYNLPPWRVILVDEGREALWEEVAAGFREHLSGDRLARYLDRLEGFRQGVAVALVFEERAVERVLREENGAAPEIAAAFVQQALGMVQLSLWLAIAAEGLAASLQHWEQLIGTRAARFTLLPEDDLTLLATVPIGYADGRPATRDQGARVSPSVDPSLHRTRPESDR
jgi:predicted oxidoreductase (fatty acid repression mutant protein)